MQPRDEAQSVDGAQLILIDACCAGGGLELEAAGILLDRAPGLDRERWGFMGWSEHNADGWNELVEEARTRTDAAAARAATAGTAIWLPIPTLALSNSPGASCERQGLPAM